jgi:glycosyltransferase involved in cell wall biosynthesis
MIVKNEERRLHDCISPVRDLFAEIVLVDTGSWDTTREIANRLGARVFSFPWRDHFGAARNESLRHARGEWIFWLDADDRIEADHRARLKRHFDSLRDPLEAFTMMRVEHSNGSGPAIPECRLFPNRPGIRWEGAIHEDVLPSARRAGCRITETSIEVLHLPDPAEMERRAQRDLRLLARELRLNPANSRTLFYLGRLHQSLGQPTEAIRHYRESLRYARGSDEWVPWLYANLSQVLRKQRRDVEALALARQGISRFPNDPKVRKCLRDLLEAAAS